MTTTINHIIFFVITCTPLCQFTSTDGKEKVVYEEEETKQNSENEAH